MNRPFSLAAQAYLNRVSVRNITYHSCYINIMYVRKDFFNIAAYPFYI